MLAMSRFDPIPDVVVPVGPCECPDTPHEQDEVYLAPVLSTRAGASLVVVIDTVGVDRKLAETLFWEVVRDYCITGWNFVDAEGQPVPLTPSNREMGLPFAKGGKLVAERASDLYTPDLLAPFGPAARRPQPSRPGPTASGRKATSPRPTSIPRRQAS